ncbi:MAG: hypothetical protein ALAOOOJD_03192 [bacterium]|nr:hypothetical protein [bacterium]
MRKKIFLFFLAAAMLSAFRAPTHAAEEGRSRKPAKLAKATAGPTTNRTLVNIGNVAMWIQSNATSATNPTITGPGLYFPRGTNPLVATIFQDGFLWGGRVNDGGQQLIRVGGQEFSAGTNPGAILSRGVMEDLNDRVNVDRVWRVRRDFATADLRQDAAEFNQITAPNVSEAQIQEVRNIYRQDWIEWPVYKGAPFYDANNDGVYSPQFKGDGSPKLFPDADEPGYADGDQVVWLVVNDLATGTTRSLFGSDPIGLEMQLTLWAYRRSDALGNVIFKQFRVIYKGTETTPVNARIDSMYFCQFVDPDLGSYGDDFVGCDTTLSLGYVYNSQTIDGGYVALGLPPPAAGYDFFAGPLVRDPNGTAIFGLKQRPGFRNLPMTAFAFFAAGQQDQDPDRNGQYTGTGQWYNLMRGFRPRPINPPQPLQEDDNTITKYRLAGDPVKGLGALDSNPGDRRMLLATGSFSMALGDTQETVIASISALGSDRLSSISALKFFDRFAQTAFDNLFDLPKPPASPRLAASEFDGQIVLNWGANLADIAATENVVQKGYNFEGYNVYQLPTAGAPIEQGIKLATYDVANELTVISQETFDPRSGLVLNLPVQFGNNTHLQRSFVVTRDQIRDKPLVNGQPYYFGVTAYSYNSDPLEVLKTLESPPAVVTVTPQKPKPGVRYGDGVSQGIVATKVAGFSDVNTLPITIIDPSKTKNAEYMISIETDGAGVPQWTLRNVTAAQDVLTSKVFGSADTGDPNDDYQFPIVDGLLVQVRQISPLLISDSTQFISGDNLWLTSGGLFAGVPGSPATQSGDITTGEDLGNNFLGQFHSSFDARGMVPVLLKFGPSFKQKAYRLRRTGTGGTYLIQSTNPTPEINVQAWDISDPAAPRQLTISWRDQIDDGVWNPPVGGDGLELLFIHYRTYDPTMTQFAHSDNGQTPIDNECTASDKADVMYGTSLALVEGHNLYESDIVFKIRPALRLSPGNKYTFRTAGTAASPEVAKADVLREVNCYPNPYYGVNRFEQNTFTRFITFSHLPDKAVVRIFNLAGVLVRTLTKGIDAADNAQFLRWNLQNEAGLPVASGIYIAHLEFPDLGVTKDLKIAIVQEQQFLRNF